MQPLSLSLVKFPWMSKDRKQDCSEASVKIWLLSEINIWNVRGGWFEIHCCKECSGNLIEICGYPDPQKTWHFDACESFVEFLSSSDQTKMTATWKMWLLSEINIWNVRGTVWNYQATLQFMQYCTFWGESALPEFPCEQLQMLVILINQSYLKQQ